MLEPVHEVSNGALLDVDVLHLDEPAQQVLQVVHLGVFHGPASFCESPELPPECFNGGRAGPARLI